MAGTTAKTLIALLLALTWVLGDAPTAAAQAAPWGAAPILSEAAGEAVVTRSRRKRKKPKPGADGEAEGEGGAATGGAAAGGDGDNPMAGMRRSNRMEFDARLVKGERPKAGAVYLFQRAPRRLPPLVKLRQSYLGEIVEPVLGAPDERDARDTGKKRNKKRRSKRSGSR